jgi:hypothetical protein
MTLVTKSDASLYPGKEKARLPEATLAYQSKWFRDKGICTGSGQATRCVGIARVVAFAELKVSVHLPDCKGRLLRGGVIKGRGH